MNLTSIFLSLLIAAIFAISSKLKFLIGTLFIFIFIPTFIASFIPLITSSNLSLLVISLNLSFINVSRLTFMLSIPELFNS